jgi:hypothetical protein
VVELKQQSGRKWIWGVERDSAPQPSKQVGSEKQKKTKKIGRF